MASDLMTNELHNGRKSYNHVLSHPFAFTSSVGQLLPVDYDFLYPGDRINWSCNLFTRTQPLETSALVDIDEYVDLFFVPIRKISTHADMVLTNIDDEFSSAFLRDNLDSVFKNFDEVEGTPVLPTYDFGALAYAIYGDEDNYSFGNKLHKYSGRSPYGFRFDSFCQGTARLLDHLGYPWKTVLVPDYGLADDIYSLYQDYQLPWAPSPAKQFDVFAGYAPSLSVGFLAAYQAIYYDYYRLTSWEQNNVLAYNFDLMFTKYSGNFYEGNDSINRYNADLNMTPWATVNTIGSQYSWNNNWSAPLTLRYRPYQRDYFRAIEPSPLWSEGILNDSHYIYNSDVLKNWLSSSSDVPSNRLDVSDHAGADPALDSSSTDVFLGNITAPIASFSPSALSQLYAVDRLLKVTARAGKHYDDQVFAHFGVKVPKGYSNEVYYIGGMHSNVHIGEVISTADTEQSPLGQIAGKGYGNQGSKQFKFEAPCHGFMMAIYSAVPRMRYITNIDKRHMMVRQFDFALPELDKLGVQPLFRYELESGVANSSVRIGWQHRWQEQKMSYPRATHAFENFDASLGKANGPFRSWTIARSSWPQFFNDSDVTSQAVQNVHQFLCSPCDLDSIMLQGYTIYGKNADSQESNVPNRYLLVGYDQIGSPLICQPMNLSQTGITTLSSQYLTTNCGVIYASDPLIHDVNITYYKKNFMSNSDDN